ncbi:uncharacterized protein LOC105942059 isoform X1 [Ochotona princeps]|uniref:uncharacterized protein LOC105942059 isoform X1 n=1 Tax=Ochotona princeps TaxID=9978 RepID=UPI00271537F1|nr:uncharacterized protein LOC105942059 isoform X1 [Ochotona princeps]XP_058516940.1 uncharacterized protein LOC105942059 isoform X1 [Ochotona princeps]
MKAEAMGREICLYLNPSASQRSAQVDSPESCLNQGLWDRLSQGHHLAEHHAHKLSQDFHDHPKEQEQRSLAFLALSVNSEQPERQVNGVLLDSSAKRTVIGCSLSIEDSSQPEGVMFMNTQTLAATSVMSLTT